MWLIQRNKENLPETNLYVLINNCTRWDCHSSSCIWRPDYWLEVSRHHKGPENDQLDQGFP